MYIKKYWDQKHKSVEQAQQETVAHNILLVGGFACSIHPGNQDVDARAGSGCNRRHEQLNRVNQRNGGQTCLGIDGNEIAVHHVINGLNEQSQHNRRGHFQQ